MPVQDTWYPKSSLKVTADNGRYRTWTVTPNFGALPKDAKPVNPYDDWRIKVYQDLKYWTYNNGGAPIVFFNNVAIYSNGQIQDYFYQALIATPGVLSVIVDLRNVVAVKVLGKISDAKVNVAVALAEATKTSDLILDTARRLDRAYRALRRGNLKEVANNLNITPKRLHKSWLEYKYGWMPLLMDVKNSAEFLAQQNIGRPPRFTCVATESRDLSLNRVSAMSAWGSVPAVYNGREVVSHSSTAKAKVWCELVNPHLSAAQQLGLTNPALVAWELVPFSFVFDWFISVGDYLQAITALDGVSVRRAMFSIKMKNVYTHTQGASSQLQGGYTYNSSGNNFGASNEHYVRATLDLSPSSLYPPKTSSFSFQKMVTSLALIRGSYRGDMRTQRI